MSDDIETQRSYQTLLDAREKLGQAARRYFPGIVAAGVALVEGEPGLAVIFAREPSAEQKAGLKAALGERFEGYPYKFVTARP